jgi:hypothetical protein
MRARYWKDHEETFRRYLQEAHKKYPGWSEGNEAFAGFENPSALVEFLNARTGDRDLKIRIYEALVRVVQARCNWFELARIIAMLGLWHWLTIVFRSQRKNYIGAEDQLVSDIETNFFEQLEKLNLSKVKKIDATLFKNTRREVITCRRLSWNYDALHVCMPTEDGAAIGASQHCSNGISDFGILQGLTPEEETAAIQKKLTGILGQRKADFMVRVAIYGESQPEAGSHMGINGELSKKWFQRLSERIRKNIEKARQGCPC